MSSPKRERPRADASAWLRASYRGARRVVVAVIGFTVVGLGLILLVAPGPAFVVIPLGLAILSLEFAWARHWLHKLRELVPRERNASRNQRMGEKTDRPGVADPRQER